MKEFVDFLNSNSGLFNLVFAGVVSIATVFYVILTKSLVKETKKLRKVETDPLMSVYIEHDERWIQCIDLVIRNIGNGPAYDITFNINPDFLMDKNREKKLSDIPFMREIRYLPPGNSLKTFLAQAPEVLNRDKSERCFDITTTYKGKDNKKYKEVFKIDFEMLTGKERIGEHPLVKISKTIDQVAKELRRMEDQISKMLKKSEK